MNISAALGSSPISLAQLSEIAYSVDGIMKFYFSDFGVQRVIKIDATPVTEADLKINKFVIRQIRKISKLVDIVGEEQSDRTDSPWQIVCDPVDGTFPYTWGVPVSTFMLGLLYRRQPVMGVIYDPFSDRLYVGQKSDGAWIHKRIPKSVKPIKVSTASSQDGSTIGFVSWPKCPYNILRACQYLEERGITVVNFASIGYMEMLVANGELAATLFPGTKHHDTAPGHIIVEEAGGKVTDVFGRPLHYQNGAIDGHICSNGTDIHDLIVEAVRFANG